VLAPASAHSLELADGSALELAAGAEARVVRQEARNVRIQQNKGRVGYRVAHDPERSFTVAAAGVEIRVRGTEFSVELSGQSVAVHVQSGRVEVFDGSRVTTLLGGEELRVRAGATSARTESDSAPPALSEPGGGAGSSAGKHVPPPAKKNSAPASASESTESDPVDALFRAANDARAQSDTARAAAALRQIVQRHPRDARVASAYFTLGRVERSRAAHAAAARAFAQCASVAPGGTLASEALAEAAAAWLSAGQRGSAARIARQYLQRFPSGSHALQMQQLLE
jgi:transmembrane sensor